MTPDSATCLMSIARSSVASARRRVMSGTKVQARNRLQRTDDQALFSVNTNIFKYREFVQARFIRVRIDWSAQDFADEQFTDHLQIKSRRSPCTRFSSGLSPLQASLLWLAHSRHSLTAAAKMSPAYRDRTRHSTPLRAVRFTGHARRTRLLLPSIRSNSCITAVGLQRSRLQGLIQGA